MELVLFGKHIITTFNHIIMELNYSGQRDAEQRFEMVCVTHNKNEFMDAMCSAKTLAKVIDQNVGLCDVFVFKNSKDREIGTISVMYKGGNDLEYRIREIDAYIFNVWIVPDCRGCGYISDMIHSVQEYLYHKGIESVFLACRINNVSAMRAYDKIGFKKVKHTSFVRILGINIPYLKI